MDRKLQNAAESFLSGGEGSRLAGKEDTLKRLAASRDGESVRSILENHNFQDAVSSGNTAEVRSAIQSVMSTEAGARLLRQLQQLMEK